MNRGKTSYPDMGAGNQIPGLENSSFSFVFRGKRVINTFLVSIASFSSRRTTDSTGYGWFGREALCGPAKGLTAKEVLVY